MKTRSQIKRRRATWDQNTRYRSGGSEQRGGGTSVTDSHLRPYNQICCRNSRRGPGASSGIVSNDDNLSYGSIISVYTGDDESVTALTDDGMDELEQMLKDARRSPQEWKDFLESFVDDEELVARIKAKSTR